MFLFIRPTRPTQNRNDHHNLTTNENKWLRTTAQQHPDWKTACMCRWICEDAAPFCVSSWASLSRQWKMVLRLLSSLWLCWSSCIVWGSVKLDELSNSGAPRGQTARTSWNNGTETWYKPRKLADRKPNGKKKGMFFCFTMKIHATVWSQTFSILGGALECRVVYSFTSLFTLQTGHTNSSDLISLNISPDRCEPN